MATIPPPRAYRQGQFVAFVVRSETDERTWLSTGHISLLGSRMVVISLVTGQTAIVPVEDLRPFPSGVVAANPYGGAADGAPSGAAPSATHEDRMFWMAVCGSWAVPERDGLSAAADAAMLESDGGGEL